MKVNQGKMGKKSMKEEQIKEKEWWTNLCNEISAVVWREAEKKMSSEKQSICLNYEDEDDEPEYEIEMILGSRKDGPDMSREEVYKKQEIELEIERRVQKRIKDLKWMKQEA